MTTTLPTSRTASAEFASDTERGRYIAAALRPRDDHSGVERAPLLFSKLRIALFVAMAASRRPMSVSQRRADRRAPDRKPPAGLCCDRRECASPALFGADEPLADSNVVEPLWIVSFQSFGPPRGVAPGRKTKREIKRIKHIDSLEAELLNMRERLQSTIEELETSNEELKSSNEELQSLNEELQSANEELETSKEELQSVNEELETVNSEPNSKVENLDRANSDLKKLLESAQIATGSPDAIIVLDSAGKVLAWNHGAEQMYGHKAAQIVGQNIDSVVPPETAQEWKNRLRQAQGGQSGTSFEIERLHRNGGRMRASVKLAPVGDSEGKVAAISSIERAIADKAGH